MGSSKHTMPFVHLRVQSAYSIGVGVSTPREICRQAQRSGFNSVALTDTGGTWGFVEFHKAAREFGIKPVYGLTVGYSPDGTSTGTDLVLLALDRQGLQNICSLSSLVYPDLTSASPADLRNQSDGLVCIVAPRTDIHPAGSSLLVKDPEKRRRELVVLDRLFGDRLFLGFSPGDQEFIRPWLTASVGEDIQKVLVQDVRYVGFKHYSFVSTDNTPPAESSSHSATDEESPIDRYRFLSPNEVSEWYAQFPDAYANASMIASLVNPDLLDRLDTAAVAPESQTLFDADKNFQADLEELAEQKLAEVLSDADDSRRDRYQSILTDELRSIARSGIAESFLRFHEILAKLVELGVVVGPSTGLRLQSLCAWLLGITQYDPYETDDHFLADMEEDPLSRKILDLQIASGDRPVAAGVIRQLFGGESVGYLPTVEHVTPLRALKVANSEMDIVSEEFEEIIRIAGDRPGITLQKLCEENRDIGRLYRRSAGVRELFQTAAAIEGLPLGFIKSKRTLVASSMPVKKYVGHTLYSDGGALFFQSTRDSFPTESVFRIDISTLTALGVCAGVDQFIDPECCVSIPWTRPSEDSAGAGEVYNQVTDGDTFGIYLLESPLTQRLAEQFDVSSFDGLVNFLALMRTRRGDLSFAGRVEAFKKEQPATEDRDPEISFLLNDTNGWILYKDQLREILSVLTSLSGREASDMIRRFGDHDAGDLAALRMDFMKNAAEGDVPQDTAASWFKRLMFYFPRVLGRQHIVADALLVYRMLVLKHGNRTEFITALLNVHREHRSRMDTYTGMAQAEALLLAPHINQSDRRYLPENGLIRMPFSQITGLTDTAIDAILIERKNGKFSDMENFIARVPSELVKNEDIEAIAVASAMDSAAQLGKSHNLNNIKQLDAVTENSQPPVGQVDLFQTAKERPDEGGSFPELTQTKKDGNIRSGFHVLTNIAEFYPHPAAARVELVGRVRDLRSFRTSSGDEISFFVLFDTSASISVFAPREQIGRAGEPLAEGDRVLVRGVVRIRDRRKVCNAVEVQAEGGAISDGETSSDEPTEGNP